MTQLATLLVFTALYVTAKTDEICLEETFSPICQSNEVIVIKSASYGRMKLGGCVKRDFGFLECRADALQLMDTECSGLQSCSFQVMTGQIGLKRINKCPVELISYLEVDYSCVKVDSVDQRFCSQPPVLRPADSSGVLASYITDSTSCGTKQYPWTFNVSPGQKLNITLLDFGWRIEQQNSSSTVNNMGCAPYGYIIEKAVGTNQTICGGSRRQEHVHLSTTSKLEIAIIPRHKRDAKSNFLLFFEVVGCRDLSPPAHAWYKRQGDSARIGCEWNHNSWHLRCEGNSWSGVVGNCSAPDEVPASSEENAEAVLSPVLSIALIIGLGVLAVTLVCILLIGCIYFKRRSRRRSPLAPDLAKCGTMIEQHGLVTRYHPGQAAPMFDINSGEPCGPPTQQPYPVRCGTGPHGMTASRAPPQPWDRSLPNPRGGPPAWGTGPQPDYSCPRPRGGQGGTLIKDKDKELDTSDSGSDYYWAGTHKYHVLDKDKPDWPK